MSSQANRVGSKARICVLGPSLEAVSGVSTHLQLLFSSSLNAKYDLIHFQVGSQGRHENVLLRLVRRMGGPVAFLLFLLRRRPDVVHLNTSLDQKSYWRDLVFLLLARSFGCTVVFQKHGGPLPQFFFPKSKALSGLFRLVLRVPAAIVVLGREEGVAYRRFVPGQRVVEIPNAVEPNGVVSRSLAEVKSGPLHLVYIGRIVKNKGVFDAVEAVARLVGEGRKLRFTFAGTGPDEEAVRVRVRELGLTDTIQFAGALFGKDKDALWRGADVFVFPTYHLEGLPYALLEGMAAGAVPVTTRVGAIPDVLEEAVHGLFVPPRDVETLVGALRRLDSDRGLLLRLARAGRQRVLEHYGVERLGADFEQLYETVRGQRS